MTAGDGNPGAGDAGDWRGHYIPVRKSDILDALVEHGHLADDAEREKFRQVCKLLAAIYHYEYFDRLERLRDDYYYFNPMIEPHDGIDPSKLETAYSDLVDSLTDVLKGANFVEMPHSELDRLHREQNYMRVALHSPLDDFRDVRIFRRGKHRTTFEISKWFGLQKRKFEADVNDDVVLFVAMKPESAITSKRERKLLAERKIRPGSVLIKYFRGIADHDLNALFPNVRVVMSAKDKLVLGLPAVAGGVPIVMNLASTITVLFLVIGFYLGISGQVQESEMKKALAALSGLAALGAYIVQQWVKYQRQSLKYQKRLSDNIYFRNVNNNAGIFDYIIGAAEEQECKEAFLAYYFLSTAKSAPTEPELDAEIEKWLKDTFHVDVDFEVDDALAKLERLNLLRHDGERLSVPEPALALERLDEVWDNYFQYHMAKEPVVKRA